VINLRGLEIVVEINPTVIMGETIARYRRLHARRQEKHEASNQRKCHDGSDFGIRLNVELDEHPELIERMLSPRRRVYRHGL
jgi:hypothetical protein